VVLTFFLAPTFGLLPRLQLIHLYNWTGSEGLAKCADLQGSFLVTSCEWAGYPTGYFVYENIVTKSLSRFLSQLPGVNPFDAWQTIGIVYLMLGIWSCINIVKIFTGVQWPGVIAAFCYFAGGSINSNPGLNQVFHGSALLPVALWILLFIQKNQSKNLYSPLFFFLYSFISGLLLVNVFGYVFLFYAVIALVVLSVSNIKIPHNLNIQSAWKSLRSLSIPLSSLFGFFFVSYFQKIIWPPNSVEVFDTRFLRGASNDFIALFLPNKSNLLWSSILNISENLGIDGRYGSRTPFLGLFSLLLTFAAILVLFKKRKQLKENDLLIVATLTALFAAIIFSLGPSFRFNDPWPTSGRITTYNSRLMPAESATFEMPWSFLFNRWGLGVGRVVDRWSIPTSLLISITAATGLFLLGSHMKKRFSLQNGKILFLIIPICLFWVLESTRPSINDDWSSYLLRRNWITNYQSTFLQPLESSIPPGSLVLHLPASNDYLSPSVGPLIGQRVFNVGGDKNLLLVRPNWPVQIREAVSAYPPISPDSEEAAADALYLRTQSILTALLSEEVDVVSLNSFSLRTAGYGFPPNSAHVTRWSSIAHEASEGLKTRCDIQELPYSLLITNCS
jgi:hypothetical protein